MADIETSNSGAGFFGFHGVSERGIEWIDQNVEGAQGGTAWCDDRAFAMDIAEAAVAAGLEVI